MRARKISVVERRLFTRLHVPLEVRFRIVDLWSSEQSSRVIEGRTWNISYDGLCIETHAAIEEGVIAFSHANGGNRVKVLPFLVMKEQQVEVEIDLPSSRGKVIALGRVVWSDLRATDRTYQLKIGVLLEEMAPKEREKWHHYIRRLK